jgi:hypothetical protein
MRLANCWLVAMWLWLATACKSYAWIRRSHAFRGRIPHFGFADVVSWKHLRVIEYIPPKKHLWTRRNLLLLFEGEYRVWHFKVVAVRRWNTHAEAMADHGFTVAGSR